MDFARPEGLLALLDRGELDAVAACVAFARRTRLTPAARFFSRLGNGWLYPIASALLLLASPGHALPYILAAGVSTGLAHLLYPPLKRLLARPRPCDLEPSLADDCQPLDRYSCPSGHAMTAA